MEDRRPRAGKWWLAAALAALLCAPASPRAQGTTNDPPVPEAAAQCLSCHGSFGRPDNLDYPIIGGQNASYLAAALRAYRAGQRTSDLAQTMTPFAQGLDDRTIEDLAAFFSTLRSLR
jgi:cytochrome c553